MQTSYNVYPIGYLLRSTEKGEYKTIKNSLSKVTGEKTEASYQMIHQKDISTQVWEAARLKAEMDYSNPNSK